MAIAERIPPPAFVDPEAPNEGGLDLLGLRLPVQGVGLRLLDGVTTIAPTVRYLSLRTWLIYRYAHAEPPPADRHGAFVHYMQRAEAAFAFANLLDGHPGVTLVGSRKALRILEEGPEVFPLDKLAEQPAALLYGGPSDQLRLTEDRRSGIPGLHERALPLVEAADATLGATAIGRRLAEGEYLDRGPREEIEEFARVASVTDIPDAERRELVRIVLPEAPRPSELPRLATYAALLALADRLPEGQPLGEEDLFDEADRPARRVATPLFDILDGWLLYAVRDALAVTAEHSLDTLLRTLRSMDPDGAGVPEGDLVARAVTETMEEQEKALREIGLLDTAEPVRALSFPALADRVGERTLEAAANRGIRRWDGRLTESRLARGTGGMAGGALSMGVVAWLLAERRVGERIRESDPWVARLLRDEDLAGRLGLGRVVLPRLADWRERLLPLAAVLGEYAHLVIDQHLRVAWSRLARDPSRDVSVLRRDGDRLTPGAAFGPGRAATRLKQAIGWLEQLRLLEDGRTTDEGRAVVARAAEALR
jgi:hypothetical protein